MKLAALAAACLMLSACGGERTRPPIMSEDAELPLTQVQPALDVTWRTLDSRDEIGWSAARTPFFPNEWPTTPNTVWTSLVYAYGNDPASGLADGQRVAAPWARVEILAEAQTAHVIKLRDSLIDSGDVQGMRPLGQKEIETITPAGDIIGPPDLAAANAEALRRYYAFWLRNHGAICRTLAIPEGFLRWARE
jgi:hypothetical protein